MSVIDGRKISEDLKKKLKEEIQGFDKKPGLGIVLIGNNPASKVFVEKKVEACRKVGVKAEVAKIAGSSLKEVKSILEKFNLSDSIHGIIVQLPLPFPLKDHELEILSLIDSRKDVDCLHPYNLGKLITGKPEIIPASAAACIEMLNRNGIEVRGKKIVVVGWGETVGKPLSFLLLSKGATVTVCHEFTKDLKKETLTADILISAVGKSNLITEDMVKDNVVVLDAGTVLKENKVVGDVDFDKVKEKVKLISPVPGGVGPVTVAMLISNLVEGYKKQV